MKLPKPFALFFCFIVLAVAAKCAATEIPQLVIKKYPSQIEPTHLPLQTIKADNPFYSVANDPSLVTFISATDRKLHITIDNRYNFSLLPNKSKCLAFPINPGREDIAKHTVQVRVERLTQYYGSWDTTRTFNFYIRLDGQPQMFSLSDR